MGMVLGFAHKARMTQIRLRLRVVLQIRWSIARKQLPTTWSAVPIIGIARPPQIPEMQRVGLPFAAAGKDPGVPVLVTAHAGNRSRQMRTRTSARPTLCGATVRGDTRADAL